MADAVTSAVGAAAGAAAAETAGADAATALGGVATEALAMAVVCVRAWQVRVQKREKHTKRVVFCEWVGVCGRLVGWSHANEKTL